VLTGLARHTIRAAALHERRPSAILRLLNEAIRSQPPSQELCSAAYARLDIGDSPIAVLSVSSGGHPLPLVLRGDGTVESVDARERCWVWRRTRRSATGAPRWRQGTRC
jgi:sigma-B regulation protein RsbU (phosphoserine phosphatase)